MYESGMSFQFFKFVFQFQAQVVEASGPFVWLHLPGHKRLGVRPQTTLAF